MERLKTGSSEGDEDGHKNKDLAANNKLTSGWNGVIEKKERLRKRIHNFIRLVCQTDLQLFMAYTATTVTLSFLVGSMMSGLLNRWYNAGLEERILMSVMKQLENKPTFAYITEQNGQSFVVLKKQFEHMCEANMNKTKTSVDETVKRLETKLNRTTQELQMNQTKFENEVSVTQFHLQGQVSTLSSYFLNNAWSYMIVLLGLGEVFLLVVVVKMMPLIKQSAGRLLQHVHNNRTNDVIEYSMNSNVATRRYSNRISGSDEILDQVRPMKLNPGVCTISFHSECADKHNKQTDDILKSSATTRQVRTYKFLLNRHDDVMHVPATKVYVVYVDFNERNVILEDPTKGLGDLRLTTVQAMQKRGGDVILVYSRDIGSMNLPHGDLYNDELTSIRAHPELSRLSARDRMFSIHEEFTKYQKEQIRRVIVDNAVS